MLFLLLKRLENVVKFFSFLQKEWKQGYYFGSNGPLQFSIHFYFFKNNLIGNFFTRKNYFNIYLRRLSDWLLFRSNDLWMFFFWVLLLPCTHLNPAPSTSIQLSATPKQYLNQNIVLNWAISPNLGRKIKNCPFRLQIGTHGILEVLILNPDLDFWNSDSKIHVGQIWAQKFKIVCFVWKLVYLVSQGS